MEDRRAGNVETFSYGKSHGVGFGASVIMWDENHTFYAVVTAAAVIAGDAALVSFARHRHTLIKRF